MRWLLSRLLGEIHLRVELIRLKPTWRRLDSVPIRAQSNDLKGMPEEDSHRGPGVQTERFDLRRSKADSQPGGQAGLDWHLLPALCQRARGSLEADL